MNISKKQWMWIIVAVAIFLIYWFYFRNKKDGESGYKRNVGQGGNCFANKECSPGLVCRNGKCMPPVVRTSTTMPAPAPSPVAPVGGPRSVASSSTVELGAPMLVAPTPVAVDSGTATLTPRSSTITNTLTGMSSIDGTTTL